MAIKLFMGSGFQKVSIDDIAKEAGLTKATVYYYFRSKSELFKEALVELMGRIRNRIDHLLDSDQSLYNRLLEVAKGHLKATTMMDLEGFIRESKMALSDEQVEAMMLAEEKMFRTIEQAFKQASDSGEIPPIDARFVAHSYIALLKVGNYRGLEGESLFKSTDDAAKRILDLLWKGLLG